MKKIQHTVKKHDKYQFVASLTRNIILMGRARTGKSTVARTLQNSDYVPEADVSLFSETKDIEFHEFAAHNTGTNTSFHFNVIDTPGFYDQVANKGKPLTNEFIATLINKCVKQDMTNIHCFAFVFNLHNGINAEDIKSMVYVKENFPNTSDNMILLVTNCEETTEDRRSSMMNNFFKHQQVVQHGLKEFFHAGIFYMGCLRHQLRENPNIQAAGVQIKNVLAMRQTLIDYLIRKEGYFNIHHSPIPITANQTVGMCSSM